MDREYYRSWGGAILKDGILQMRDINDNSHTRYQYRVQYGLLFSRRLPDKTDTWTDDPSAAQWRVRMLGEIPQSGPVYRYWQEAGGKMEAYLNLVEVKARSIDVGFDVRSLDMALKIPYGSIVIANHHSKKSHDDELEITGTADEVADELRRNGYKVSIVGGPGVWGPCQRCGHGPWKARGDTKPLVCPNPKCKSRYWDKPRKTKEEGKEMMYFLRGTVANGEIIFQNGWEWANDLTLNGPASNENEVGSCVPNANGYWEHRGFRQIIAKEAESILADAGYLEMPEEWFPQERKD
jgi:hypothetical protein